MNKKTPPRAFHKVRIAPAANDVLSRECILKENKLLCRVSFHISFHIVPNNDAKYRQKWPITER